jgi:hypothetical protein
LLLSGIGFGVAISAVYRLVAAGLEGNFRLFAAPTASCGEHLAGTATAVAAAGITTLSLLGCAAGRTTLGLIGEAFGSVEFLLFDRKGEGFSAIGTL